MSDHEWVLENVAAYVAGGLDPGERGRLEAHAADCAACAAALAETRALDGKLGALFAEVRPTPHQLSQAPPERRARLRIAGWAAVGMGAAAAVMLTVLGAGIAGVLEEEQGALPSFGFDVGQSYFGVLRSVLPGSSEPSDRSDLALSVLKDRLRSADELALEQAANQNQHQNQTRLWSEGYSPLVAITEERDTKHKEPANGRLEDGLENQFQEWTKEAGRLQPPILGTSPLAGATWARTKNGRDLERSAGDQGKDQPGGNFTFGFEYQDSAGGPSPAPPLPPAMPPAASAPPARTPPAAEPYFRPAERFADLKDGEKDEKEKLGKPAPQAAAGEPAPDKPGEAKQPEGQPPAVPKPAGPKPAEAPAERQPATAGRKIIRSGEIEFEVDSFDRAEKAIRPLVKNAGGFIATVNSEKLPNGKMRGAVVLRVPPTPLDDLVGDLRQVLGKMGELKGQRIGSQDITKQYTDLESRLRAARTMEERLLKIIKEGKGEIKDLVLAEKELGVWRTRIEEQEGELRYYANQVTLSTLTVALTEKEIRTAAAVQETERVQARVEVENVKAAAKELEAQVGTAQGRVTRSEVKEHGAGQYTAQVEFEVPQPAAETILGFLGKKDFGAVAKLERSRVQQAEGGSKLPLDGKLERGNTHFSVSLYNLANVAPRETVVLRVAAADVAAAYGALRDAVGKTKGRLINAQINEQDRQNITATLDFHVFRADEPAVRAALAAAGEVLTRSATRVPENENVTDAKVHYKLDLINATAIEPREAVTLAIEVSDVEAALSVAAARVKDAQGRTVKSQIGQERSGRVTARAVYDVPLSAADGLVDRLRQAGQVRVHQVSRNPQAPDGKLATARLDLTLSNVDVLVPRDEGLMAQVRHGLSVSLRGLALSVNFLIIGVLFVLPWGLLSYAVLWLARRLLRGTAPGPVVPSPPAGAGQPTGTGG